MIAEVYAGAGRVVTPEAAEAFAAFEKRRLEGHFGSDTYTAEQFGLIDERIEDEFAAYLQRFPDPSAPTAARAVIYDDARIDDDAVRAEVLPLPRPLPRRGSRRAGDDVRRVVRRR